MTSASRPVHGEELQVPERVIVAPVLGVFQPVTPDDGGPARGSDTTDGTRGADDGAVEGEMVTEGQVVGVVQARGRSHPVYSAFTGFLMGMLAHPGERVREGQPVAWLRVV
jgi:multidrug efflux pump subunit AcrA (membrane-fusion protein)